MRTFPDQRSNEVARFKPPTRGQKLALNQIQLLSDYVELNHAALDKGNAAIRLPKCRFPIDFAPGFQTLLPHLGKIKTLAQIARDKALLSINSGHAADAIASLRSILGLARTLDEEPVLISQLVRIAVTKIATATLEPRLNAGDLSEMELIELMSAFVAVERLSQLSRVFSRL